MKRTVVLLGHVLFAAAMLTGCGGGEEPSTPAITGERSPVAESPTTAQPGPEIVIANNTYTVPESVQPGEPIRIVNNAESNHTVTADTDNLFDVRISGGGGIATLTAPAEPGGYPFHCKYHANMSGTLTVQ